MNPWLRFLSSCLDSHENVVACQVNNAATWLHEITTATRDLMGLR